MLRFPMTATQLTGHPCTNMKLIRCYRDEKTRAYGYAPTWRSDFAFVFILNDSDPEPDEETAAEVLVKTWSNAPAVAEPCQKRSVLFFPDTGGSLNKMGEYAKAAVTDGFWGSFFYWRKPDLSKVPIGFPSGENPRIVVSENVSCDLWQGDETVQLRSLDELKIGWSNGLLKITGVDSGCVWRVRYRDEQGATNVLADSEEAFVDLGLWSHGQDRSGAVLVSGDGSSFKHAEMSFSRVLVTSGARFKCDHVLRGRPLEQFTAANTRCYVAMDARDIGMKVPEKDQRLSSRLEFLDDTQLVSNFTAEQGHQMLLIPARGAERGLLRLQLRMNGGRVARTGQLSPSVSPALFTPEGTFFNAGFRINGNDSDTSGTKRLLAGGSTTEFVETRFGDAFVFTRNFPSEITDESSKQYFAELDSKANPPEAVARLANAQGLLTTAWVHVRPGNRAAAVVYVTEPVRAPQFDVTTSKVLPTGVLGRANVRLGAVEERHLPVFPLLGRIQSKETLLAEKDGKTDYDTSHLAEARRIIIRPPGSKGTKIKRRGKGAARQKTAQPPDGVTPQGILTAREPAGDLKGDFRTLYFGSAEPEYLDEQGQPQVREEFRLAVTAPGSGPESDAWKFYQKLQLALRGSDLFMIFSKREGYTKGVVNPEVDITLRNFRFEISEIDTQGGVFFVKYFKNRSLKELVTPEAVTAGLWACREDLAPRLTPTDIEKLVKIAKPPNWYNDFLQRVWENRDWQGILFLNFLPDGMPELFEALKGGMDEANLKFHHFGLDFMPVKAADLQGKDPHRLAAAFGVLRYTKGTPPHWESDDTIPAETKIVRGKKRTSTDDPPDLGYQFTVNSLELSFFNSQIRDFEAEVEAAYSHLFWDAIKPSKKGELEKLILKGSYESRPGNSGATSDLFRLRIEADKEFKFDKGSWIDAFHFQEAELSVLSTKSETGERRIRSFLGMSGELKFNSKELPLHDFVVLNKITVHKMGAEYDYYPDHVGKKRHQVRFKIEDADVDAEVGPAANVFLSWLPVKFNGFKMAFAKVLKLPDLGYFNIGGLGEGFDFGLRLEFDLGSLGRLAGFKDLKLPGLFGWRRGLKGFAFGIQFPNGITNDVKLTLLDFIGVKVKAISIKTCDQKALALFFEQIQLVLFGKDIPSIEDASFNFGLFMPTGEQRKLAWMAGAEIKDSSIPVIKYLGGGYRIGIPTKDVTSTKAIVDAYKEVLTLDPNQDPCDWLIKRDPAQNGWVVVSELKYDGLFEAWLALSDAQNIYGLRLNLTGLIELDAFYRRVTEGLGIYSAELNLSSIIPPIQIGVATLTLPSIRVEVHTDGGFLIDLGYPWDRDFRRSFKIEVGIFTGGGGFYFGSMSLAAVDILMLDEPVGGFDKIDLGDPAHVSVVKAHRALRAGIAFRGGIGRSLDLGILKGEASLTFYGSLEGAVGMRGGTTRPRLFAVKGAVGIMLHIWVEVDFFVLQAKAELLAYAEAGLILQRVLAYRPNDKTFHYLTLPVTVYFEVGLYVHVEVWVTIGCVSVKLFDLSFRGSWRFEAEMGGFRSDPLDGRSGSFFLSETIAALEGEKGFSVGYRAWKDKQPLVIYATVVPCVAASADVEKAFAFDAPYHPGMVAQLAADPFGAFTDLAQFMVGWALGIQTPQNASPVAHEVVIEMRRHFKDAAAWSNGEIAKILEMLDDHFELDIRALTPTVNVDSFAAIPFWPGLTWEFVNEARFESSEVLVSRMDGQVGLQAEDSATMQFIDFLRGLTNSFLEEIDRQLTYNTPSDVQPGTFTRTWNEVWTDLAKK